LDQPPRGLIFKLFLKEHRRQDFSPPPFPGLIRGPLAIVNAGQGAGMPFRDGAGTTRAAVLVEITRGGGYFGAGKPIWVDT
jgi:hypothetical protein